MAQFSEVSGARGAPVYSFSEAGLDAGLQLRPAGGEELADLPARQPFAAGDVVKARSALGPPIPKSRAP